MEVGEGVTRTVATVAGPAVGGSVPGAAGALVRPNRAQATTPMITTAAAAPTSRGVFVRRGAENGGGGAGAGSVRDACPGADTPPEGRRAGLRGAGGGVTGAWVRFANTAVGASAISGGDSGTIGSTGVTGRDGGGSEGWAAAVAGIGVVGAAGIGVVGVEGSGVVGAAVMMGGGGGVAGFPYCGTGLTGVAHWAASASVPPRARAFICWRTGSLWGGVPMASTASSSVGQRSAGFLASIRSTACATPDGQSGRRSRIDGGGSWKCCHMSDITESASNGTR